MGLEGLEGLEDMDNDGFIHLVLRRVNRDYWSYFDLGDIRRNRRGKVLDSEELI